MDKYLVPFNIGGGAGEAMRPPHFWPSLVAEDRDTLIE